MIKRDDAQTCAQRRSVGTFVELASDEADRAEDAARRPTVSRRGDLSTQDRRAVARPPRAVRPVEVGLQSVCQLVSTRVVAAHF